MVHLWNRIAYSNLIIHYHWNPYFVYCSAYYDQGFLALQHAIDLAIIAQKTSQSPRPPDLDQIQIQLKRQPYPKYKNNFFTVILKEWLPFFLMFTFLFAAPCIVKDVVLEKEQKLKVHININMKNTSRAVPQKSCSPPISSWLGNFEKIHSCLEIWAVWRTPFLIDSKFLQYSVKIIILKLIKLDCSCLINCNLQDLTHYLVIFNSSIFAKGAPYLFQAG